MKKIFHANSVLWSCRLPAPKCCWQPSKVHRLKVNSLDYYTLIFLRWHPSFLRCSSIFFKKSFSFIFQLSATNQIITIHYPPIGSLAHTPIHPSIMVSRSVTLLVNHAIKLSFPHLHPSSALLSYQPWCTPWSLLQLQIDGVNII